MKSDLFGKRSGEVCTGTDDNVSANAVIIAGIYAPKSPTCANFCRYQPFGFPIAWMKVEMSGSFA
jgi:hypothetical protein